MNILKQRTSGLKKTDSKNRTNLAINVDKSPEVNVRALTANASLTARSQISRPESQNGDNQREPQS